MRKRLNPPLCLPQEVTMLAAIEDQGEETYASGVRLSDAAIADLAHAMSVPEELFRMVIDRYPELNQVLAHRYPASIDTPR